MKITKFKQFIDLTAVKIKDGENIVLLCKYNKDMDRDQRRDGMEALEEFANKIMSTTKTTVNWFYYHEDMLEMRIR